MFKPNRPKLHKVSVTRTKLVSLIHKRIDGVIAKPQINDALILIEEYILNQIKNNKAVSINNFGTFTTTQLYDGKSLKFIISYSFRTILKKLKREFE